MGLKQHCSLHIRALPSLVQSFSFTGQHIHTLSCACSPPSPASGMVQTCGAFASLSCPSSPSPQVPSSPMCSTVHLRSVTSESCVNAIWKTVRLILNDIWEKLLEFIIVFASTVIHHIVLGFVKAYPATIYALISYHCERTELQKSLK